MNKDITINSEKFCDYVWDRTIYQIRHQMDNSIVKQNFYNCDNEDIKKVFLVKEKKHVLVSMNIINDILISEGFIIKEEIESDQYKTLSYEMSRDKLVSIVNESYKVKSINK